MYNPESVRENETLKIRLNFGIQTNHLISARRPDLMTVNNNYNKNLKKKTKKKTEHDE